MSNRSDDYEFYEYGKGVGKGGGTGRPSCYGLGTGFGSSECFHLIRGVSNGAGKGHGCGSGSGRGL
jgi:hypothetical protein